MLGCVAGERRARRRWVKRRPGVCRIRDRRPPFGPAASSSFSSAASISVPRSPRIHTPGYFTGEQMQAWMMTDYNYAHPFGTWLSMYPSFIVASCYFVVVWEIAFIFVAWKGWGRVAMLGAGVFFHLMTTFMLGAVYLPRRLHGDLFFLLRRAGCQVYRQIRSEAGRQIGNS